MTTNIENVDLARIARVSIGMPVFNGGVYLAEALQALVQQTFSDFEIIIFDNGSTDSTAEIGQRYAKGDPRIHYVRSDQTIHPMESFNRTLYLARAPYFMWAAHDDTREPTYIEALVRILDESPCTVLAFSRFDNIDSEGVRCRTFNGDWLSHLNKRKLTQFFIMTLLDCEVTQKANAIYGLIRREALVTCNGMKAIDNITFCGEDVLALLRLLSIGEFRCVDAVLFHYRVRNHAVRDSNLNVAKYFALRIFGSVPLHRGSLILFFRRNHVFHREMRRIVFGVGSLSLFGKALLWLALCGREIWVPVKTVPKAAWYEMRPRRKAH